MGVRVLGSLPLGKGFAARDCVIARCPARSLSGTLLPMNEWTPEAIKAEIDYRRSTVVRSWRRANRGEPSWISRVTHRTSGKHRGTGS
ncbi:hypothetical protein SAMN04488000_10668 [Lentzea albida]|uniref:Uncharacterized protein n=2 Tax=Pseudonocardiaceae TaxID=2070 RepID=A0A1H9LCQ6_9PSEU|nr:hypothetical protein SAMN04488000_10668 [Lentzea albida]